jgi:hypothetical protein
MIPATRMRREVADLGSALADEFTVDIDYGTLRQLVD